MKIPGLGRMCNSKSRVLLTVCLSAVFILCCSSLALAVSEGGPKGWVATDTYRVMNFVLLAAVLFFLLRKPVSKALGDRISGIKEQLEDLESKKADAEKTLAEYNQKISNLEKEAGSIVEEYVKQGEAAKLRIIEEAEASAEKLEEQAKKSIAHEFEQAKLKLQSEIMDKALVKAEVIIKEKISADDQERLVDEYLEKVVS